MWCRAVATAVWPHCFSKCLTKHGFSVETAEDGVMAFEVLEGIRARIKAGDRTALPVDLILLDIVMPRMDGKMVLARLKEDPEVVRRPAAAPPNPTQPALLLPLPLPLLHSLLLSPLCLGCGGAVARYPRHRADVQ